MAPPTYTSGMEFEVFLSFRGSDTRDNITSCLYYDMLEKGIRVFKDDEEIRSGQKIGGDLLQALDNTQIYIPIFSKGFASSVWCLREVAYMVDCTSKSNGKKEILPLFFDVKPDDVKLRTELYSNALSEHEKKHDPKEINHWKAALREVATRLGWKREGKEYGELIKSIVQEVQLKLKVKDRSLPNQLVEVDDQKDIEKLLDVDSDGVRFVIIHGTGGIGKSTLAKVIFNRLLSKFNYSSFLEDVQSQGLLEVQKKLLSDTLGLTSTYGISDTNDGIHRIRRGLSNKRVLVVVDNVDEKRQLENLAGRCDWFGSGSRIMVTVRDIRKILTEDKQMRPSNYLAHSVNEMPLHRAIQLFSRHAFRSDTPSESYYNFSKEVVSSIGRLPLTLEIVGSLFARTDRSKWDETLKHLKQVPPRNVRESLMISVNKLDAIEKAIFLDIACFCIGEDKTYACYMWRSGEYSPCCTIDVLLFMSLIKINDNKFWMHDEVRDLGRYIVKEENLDNAGKRRWVWIDEDTLHILRSDEEKPNVRALSLSPGISHDFTAEELARFPNLKFLEGERMNFRGDFQNVLCNLRWLSWRQCSQDLSATNLHLVNLVVLDLSQSVITCHWRGWRQIEMAKNLIVLDLTGCYKLWKTPDFSEFAKLEKLILFGCGGLYTIDSSIGKLKLLSSLNMKGCTNLQGLPKEIGSMECLSEIIMPDSYIKFELPETLSNLRSLKQLTMKNQSGISRLPQHIGRLKNLSHLLLEGCWYLHELPNSIGELESLVMLDLEWTGISVLPASIGNLKRLKEIRLAHTKIHTIPYELGEVETLEVLDASFCRHLTNEVPWEKWSLTCLRIMNLYETPISTVPTKINSFSGLQTLKITSYRLCPLPELPSSLKYLVVKAAHFPVLPDLSNLVQLAHLEVCRTHAVITFWSKNKIISPWKDTRSINQLARCLSTLILRWIPQLPNFSNYQSLSVLSISGCPMPLFPDLIYLERLSELEISSCEFLDSTPDLSCLKNLQQLVLSGLPKLVDIRGLEELESLEFLHMTMCDMIKQLPYLSKLRNLHRLNLEHCGRLRAVEGLKELNSLKMVEIEHCISLRRLPDVPASTRLKTNWTPPEAAEHSTQSAERGKGFQLW